MSAASEPGLIAAPSQLTAPRRERSLSAWLSTTEHTDIALRFIVTALVFLLLGGVLALIMRLQLARPASHVVGPDLYNQVFTTHGTTMMFLFAVPVMQGLGLYFVPLMVGARNVAFPRLAHFGYWIYVCGGIFLYVALFSNTGPDAGWFSYVPLAGPEHSPGKRVDVWAQLITFTELSSLSVSVSIIVTTFKHKAPGMSLDRLPIFVWASLVTAFMVLFAMPAVIVASSCLALDRLLGTHFFNPAEGGDALLWQHMFWFFGHPEVYIIFLPGLGMVSEIVISATKRTLFGYVPVVVANVATAVLAFGLWVHHMFATGLPQLGASFFTGASILIAIPTGVQFFCWIATIWRSRPQITAQFTFVLAFFATFLIGGLTGVMLAAVPINVQVHDTFFVVAHFHYVLIGGAVFPLLGGLTHWFPKLSGRLLSERLGFLSCGLVFAGFHLTFFPQHLLGLRGMPRRIYTYLPDTGWGFWNLVSTVGAFAFALGVLVFFINAGRSIAAGARAPANPWNADSLEWAVPSPPPAEAERELFVVGSRYPLWLGKLGRITGLKPDELLVTRVVDAEPDHVVNAALPSIMPFVTALLTAGMIVACVFTPWGLPAGMTAIGIALFAWFRPTDRDPSFDSRQRLREEAAQPSPTGVA